MKHMKSSHFRVEGGKEEQRTESGEDSGEVVVRPARRKGNECSHCGETYRKLPTLLLHIREDHPDLEKGTGVEKKEVEKTEEAKVEKTESSVVKKDDSDFEKKEETELNKKETSEVEKKESEVDKNESDVEQNEEPEVERDEDSRSQETGIPLELLQAVESTMIIETKSEETKVNDKEEDEDDEEEEQLPEALCPHCGVDMVIPAELRKHIGLRHPGEELPEEEIEENEIVTQNEFNFNDFAKEVNGDEGLENNEDEAEEFDEIIDNDEDNSTQDIAIETKGVNYDGETVSTTKEDLDIQANKEIGSPKHESSGDGESKDANNEIETESKVLENNESMDIQVNKEIASPKHETSGDVETKNANNDVETESVTLETKEDLDIQVNKEIASPKDETAGDGKIKDGNNDRETESAVLEIKANNETEVKEEIASPKHETLGDGETKDANNAGEIESAVLETKENIEENESQKLESSEIGEDKKSDGGSKVREETRSLNQESLDNTDEQKSDEDDNLAQDDNMMLLLSSVEVNHEMETEDDQGNDELEGDKKDELKSDEEDEEPLPDDPISIVGRLFDGLLEDMFLNLAENKAEKAPARKLTRRQLKRKVYDTEEVSSEEEAHVSNDDEPLSKRLNQTEKPYMRVKKEFSSEVFKDKENTVEGWVCVECGLECRDKTHLRNHVLAHFYNKFDPFIPQAKPFSCPECQAESRDRITLIRHFAWSHQKFEEVTGLGEQELRPRRLSKPLAGGSRKKKEENLFLEKEILIDDLSFDILEALKNVDDQTTKKRGRGRPSRASNNFKTEVVQIDDDDEEEEIVKPSKKTKISIVKGQERTSERYGSIQITPMTASASSKIQKSTIDTSRILSSLPSSTKIMFTPAGKESGDPLASGPPAKKLLCSLCKKVFANRILFDSHVKTDHGRGRTLTEIKQVTLNLKKNKIVPEIKKNIIVPVVRTTKPEEAKCNVCKQSVEKKELSKHMETHDIKCNSCNFKCINSKAMEMHKKAKHSFKCKKCNTIFDLNEKLDAHTKAEHMFNCTKCKTIFDQKKLLEKHTLANHYFKCDKCSDVVDSKTAMEVHEKAAHSSCDVCEDEFSWAEPGHSCYYTKNNIKPKIESSMSW